MKLDAIFQNVRSEFSHLWQFKARGQSLEIITPFTTSSHKFVSVFLTERDGGYIISDGGWIDLGIYDNIFSLEDDAFQKLFFYYLEVYQIKEVTGKDGKKHFYKKTEKPASVPSIVFDLATFISNIISSSEVEFSDVAEKETKSRFKKLANNYIQSIVPNDKIEWGAPLGERRDIRFNAIYQKTNTKLILINYITGSTLSYFTSSIARANIYSEMADESYMKDYIEKKIILIDTDANGYQQDRSDSLLLHTMTHNKSSSVKWSEKEKLSALLQN